MKFLDSLVAARQMKARDALEVAIFYDKYEFVEGRRLCDQVMMEYFHVNSMAIKEKKYTIDLELIIGLVEVAHKANLEGAFKAGMTYIWKNMKCYEKPYGRMMFAEDHLKKLAPHLKYSSDNRERLGMSYICCHVDLITWDSGPESEVDHPDFPKEFVKQCKIWDECNLLRNCISHIEVTGSSCYADGNYRFAYWDEYEPIDETPRTWGGESVTFRIQYDRWENDNFEGWAILRR